MTDNPLCDFYGTCEKEETYNPNPLCRILGTCYEKDPLPCAITGDCGEEEDSKKAGGGPSDTSGSHAGAGPDHPDSVTH